MKTLDTRCVVESVFLLGQVGECGELPVKRSVLKLFPSATVHMPLAEAAGKFRSLCASGFLKFLGVPLRKHVESVTQWVELVVSGRAPKLPNTTGRIFLGKVISRFSCFMRLGAACKQTNQVEEPMIGREGLTKLYYGAA